MKRTVVYAVAMTSLLALYVWLVGVRSIALIQTGQPIAVGIGLAVLVIPALTLWFVWAEWRQARLVATMYRELQAEGDLVTDDLPRSAGGRIDKTAAIEQFGQFATRTKDHPEDWRSWFHLGWAYDAAGDRRQARTALRKAALLFSGNRK